MGNIIKQVIGIPFLILMVLFAIICRIVILIFAYIFAITCYLIKDEPFNKCFQEAKKRARDKFT